MKTRHIEWSLHCPLCNLIGFKTGNLLLQHIKKSHAHEYKNKTHFIFRKLEKRK